MNATRMGTRIALLATGLFLALGLNGQPPLTTIDDTLYKADGSPFEGVLMIKWRSFEGPGVTNIPTNSITTQVHAGRLRVKLVATTTAPTAAYYSVRYVSAGSVQFTELWSVPPSTTDLRVRDVRIDWPPATTALVAPATDIAIADVDGLTAALDTRPVRGLGYAPSRAAVIGPNGELAAAPGILTDCVRVDGTSGPCGVGGASGFVDGEAPTGSIDGVNTTYSLSGTPQPPTSLLLYRNGLLMKQDLDYTISGNTIDFIPQATPQPSDILLASYRVVADLTDTFGFVDGETPTGAVDGVNTSFSLSGSPDPVSSLLVYRNGLLQGLGVDYTLTNNVISFLPTATPQPGDILQVSYRILGN